MENPEALTVGQHVISTAEIVTSISDVVYGTVPVGTKGRVIGVGSTGRTVLRFEGFGIHALTEPLSYVTPVDLAVNVKNEETLKNILSVLLDQGKSALDRIKAIRALVKKPTL